MARQVSPLIDLRSQTQRQGVTSPPIDAETIMNILRTAGAAEQKRRERQTLDRIVRAIGAKNALESGATTIEAIAEAAKQPPEFGTGISGILQRIGGAFQPPGGGGVGQDILKTIIGQRLKQALAPKPLLTQEEQREGALIGAGIKPRAKAPTPTKRTKATVLLKQIDRKIANGSVKEGSAEHLRLLGASGDKIKTPEDKLKFWQTVLQKTKDAIGTTFEGQESTADLAAKKIEEAKNEIRQKLPAAGQTKKQTLDVTTASSILREAGGDKDKAREIARQRGFKF